MIRALPLLFLLVTLAHAGDYREVITASHPGVITNYHQHANLGQGYLIRPDGSRVYFVGLVDDGELWWWREYPRSRFDAAEVCQGADVVTSLLAAGAGAAEGNPLGVAILPLKLAINEYAESLPTQQCNKLKTTLTAAGCGAAGGNLVTMATGELTALSLAVGAAVGATATEYSFADCEAWVND
ncbi:MAG TPA: hypothetical protein ENI94_12805 [Gammaproteobacteria bacterium]|nr:hypothetical protein [Gammaproteobacteria bacterium]